MHLLTSSSKRIFFSVGIILITCQVTIGKKKNINVIVECKNIFTIKCVKYARPTKILFILNFESNVKGAMQTVT